MTKLNEHFDSIIHCHPTIQKKFVEILLNELTNKQYLIFNNDLIIKKLALIQDYVPIYFDILNQKFSFLSKLEPLFLRYCGYSEDLKTHLNLILINAFEKLAKEEISWENELDIEPIERYLQIKDTIPFEFPNNSDFLRKERYANYSDKKFNNLKQEFNSLLLDRDNHNIFSVGISNSYAAINLPKTYDIIFDTRDTTKFWEQKTVVKYAFNYRVVFHTDLWRGHHSHCLIEIIGDIPEIFDELPKNDGGCTEHKGIGLCTKYDWKFLK